MTSGPPRALSLVARVSYLESLLRGVDGLVQASLEGARVLASQTSTPELSLRRRDVVLDLPAGQPLWRAELSLRLQGALRDLRLGRPVALGALAGEHGVDLPLSLLDHADVERDLSVSRLSQAVSDLSGAEFSDLNARLQSVQGAVDVSPSALDVLQPQCLARWVFDSWTWAPLSAAHWATLQGVLHHEVGMWAREALHHANRVLLDHGVRPEIDLRPFIRRAQDTGVASNGHSELQDATGRGAVFGSAAGWHGGAHGNSGLQPLGQAFEETHLLTQAQAMPGSPARSQAVLGKLNQIVARQAPQFDPAAARGVAGDGGAPLSDALGQAIAAVAQVMRGGPGNMVGDGVGFVGSQPATPALALNALQQGKQALKQAASTPVERATIEVVALLFQSILTEDRLPAAIRVWFARLQMPVLRVAVSEPDFFASSDHPARALIDRMGACVMGFVATGDVGNDGGDDPLHREIKRVVQVVEAYPDTGRRVFQTVLTEFEAFLELYFSEQNEASRYGVSLAQQVEQRETWAIQYTIELRKMLEGVPVHDGVREFLFRVWADVLAHSAVQTSQASEETRELKRAAADLIWSASAKVSREERADVLRRLPPLLKLVREGMARAGLSAARQDEHIQSLNTALAAAFSARAASLSSVQLQQITDRLAKLDEILPDIGDVELDEQTLRDISGHETDNLEVVTDGGSMPTPAMLDWAREMKVGAWFTLDYRNRQEPVQLAWLGLQRQLILFVSPQGRGVLFQVHRLAAFLQAGLLLPAEDESLTTRATREALAKLDADPSRLLN